MLKKIVRKIKAWLYAIPFAMKAGDEIIAAPAMDPNEGVGLHEQKLQKHSVLQDLLEGKLTQEVEEFRYTMYKAEEEANNYQYLGNGVAAKKDIDVSKVKSFTIQNIELVYNSHECDMLMNGHEFGDKVQRREFDVPTRKLIHIEYDNPCVRYKIENHCESAKIRLGQTNTIELYFLNDNGNPYSRPFINHLRKILRNAEKIIDSKAKKSYFEREEVCSSVDKIEFVTHNASNNVPDGITYRFVKLKFDSIKSIKDRIVLKFKTNTVEDGKLLSEKFYSKTQDEKYKKKEAKENHHPTIDITDVIA